MTRITFDQWQKRRAERLERIKAGLFIGACLLVASCSAVAVYRMEQRDREAQADQDTAYCAMAGASPSYCYHIKTGKE